METAGNPTLRLILYKQTKTRSGFSNLDQSKWLDRHCAEFLVSWRVYA